jgi:hypothetical protein
MNFWERYPQINKYKIVFDNQMTVFTYEQLLPDVDQNGITENIMGPNRANRQEEYKFSIKRVGNPIDLSLLRSLKEFYSTENGDNVTSNSLQNIKKVVSIVSHEHCSSNAEHIYNRSFFSQPVSEDRYGCWDLGLGKALWRGFYSCLVFAKGSYQLLMNLDGKYE